MLSDPFPAGFRLPDLMRFSPARLARYAAVGLALAASPASAQTDGQVLDEVVAVVGGEPVLNSEVEAFAAQFAQQNLYGDAAYRRAMDDLIAQKVLLAHAQRDTTVIVTNEAVNDALNRRIGQLAQQVGGDEQVEALYGKPLAEIREQFRGEIRKQLLVQQFQGRRARQIRVTPAEVRAFFESIPEAERPEVPDLVRVSHVVRKPVLDPAAKSDARGLAEALRDSVIAGDLAFEDAATRYTADPGSKARGGRYAGINVRELVPEFGAVAQTLEPGAISGVFETGFGYHFMRLNERRGDVIDFNHVLIRIDDSRVDGAAALAMLETLRDSVVAEGVPFGQIAKRHSEDPASAPRGGALADAQGGRDLPAADLGALWQATLDTLEVGEVSMPTEVRLLDGARAFHIVLLQRKTPAHPLDPQTDYALLSEYALQEKRARELDAWVQKLRETVYVDVRTDRYAAGS